jgi:uncharacterized membrane protein
MFSNAVMLVLRLIHIGSGVVWAGGAIVSNRFIEPAAKDAGEAGPRFMGALIKRGFSTAMAAMGGLTFLSGAAMYWNDSNGFTNQWNQTGPGLLFTIGAIAGLSGLIVGGAMMSPAARQMQKIGEEVAKAGGPPSAEQGAAMGQFSARLSLGGRITAVLLGIAVLCMASAQYAF